MEETNYDRKTVGIVTTDENSEISTPNEDEKEATTSRSVPMDDEPTYSRKTYWQKLSLFYKPKRNLLWTMMKRPFLFFTLPVVVYCGFTYGASIMWLNLITGTTSLIMSYPPYSFAADIVGLFSVAPLIGVAFG